MGSRGARRRGGGGTRVVGKIDTQQVIGVPRAEIPKLVGAPEGSVVEVWKTGDKSVAIDVKHPVINGSAQRSVIRENSGKLRVKNELLMIKSDHQGKGIGAKMLYTEVKAIREHGGGIIETLAARSSLMNGYYTWAQLGYDAKLPPVIRKKLPASLSGAKKVSDLMSSQEGNRWWKEHGVSLPMTFNVAPNSLSSRRLKGYIEAKGLDS